MPASASGLRRFALSAALAAVFTSSPLVAGGKLMPHSLPVPAPAGSGAAALETLMPGTPHEMISVYHRDGNDLVTTHYCAARNQPRMRAKTVTGNVIALDFDGGTNLDPSKDLHIHGVRIELLGPDEIREEWIGWKGGKPESPTTTFHLKRRAS